MHAWASVRGAVLSIDQLWTFAGHWYGGLAGALWTVDAGAKNGAPPAR